MKSEGLVPMEIPLGLIPRLMTKGESAWRKVKIEGSREKFPSGVFRRSEGIQCPTIDSSRNCVIGAEPGMAVSGHPPLFTVPVRIRDSRASRATFPGRGKESLITGNRDVEPGEL
ncbi:hypothetical protein ACOSQ2_003173 [Xanthoceras sorbifolium]